MEPDYVVPRYSGDLEHAKKWAVAFQKPIISFRGIDRSHKEPEKENKRERKRRKNCKSNTKNHN